ncbi:Rpn family recombination-promoting nuclease/putative transposase [Beggiatoa leptomitoformis]|uniref:Rpn family recombination-promoting nuclease/putative transposase n=1 Tax=Beggiatoa leptomitoformis TaxID=288004 RepID=A0A2N9YDL2_9GAMM|nr:Rpn family recombination-promoting nuclease/putative transposase [Beggiatoa leptomitoformis]ALG69130.2 Rpn family recombination-promoting nuclease/putative transposase [Beggiatoa leptomitoformis]AUI68455.2 Rpn family recombination-promoting nuclease/putative transposase [Beggiatoa leptomitoformis]
MSRYFNPYTDFGFKKLFGEEANKDLLIDFLNQLLPAHHQIQSLQFKNTEKLPLYPDDRKAFFDIYCTSPSGEHFIVEMQRARIDFFKDRSLYYITFPIQEQAKKGVWDFKLSTVYFVAILDCIIEEPNDPLKFRQYVSLKDQDGELFCDKLHFCFLQMPLFDKKAEELENHFEKWVFFLKNLADFEEIPRILNEPVFQKAFEIAELSNLKPNQARQYQKSLMNYWSNKAVLDTAFAEGKEEGIIEGIVLGKEEGIILGKEEGIILGKEEGIIEGIVLGERQAKREIAKQLKTQGLPLETIMQVTGLSKQEIED